MHYFFTLLLNLHLVLGLMKGILLLYAYFNEKHTSIIHYIFCKYLMNLQVNQKPILHPVIVILIKSS